ncbi:putative histidine-containing phosphotransfer protein 2 [Hibiscus syriacus]|uniref:Histidine-containing phosphotransfer protein 2 n=1 Tax=Hibiscus syriacus TaxID=106335 RepID=A0A6A3B0N9_HIBSY|nr:putative histidine-containing phosphotransfer protein 2 [Hibiscus syriacus]
MTTVGYCKYRQAIPGSRRYSPLQQPTVQQVMIETLYAGPVSVFLIGAHTNLSVFLMNYPHLKKNIEHIYVMGGGVLSENPRGCCFGNASSSSQPGMCDCPGNLFTDYIVILMLSSISWRSFAAYQVFHSGIPITIVPLDATNTIPITEDTIPSCGSLDHALKKDGDHSGHVQTGLRDPYCFVENGKGKCKDGYTMEVTGPGAVCILVASKAKPNPDVDSKLDRFNSFWLEVLYKPDFGNKKLGNQLCSIWMRAGFSVSILSPQSACGSSQPESTPTGWANPAAIDIIYDLLHMMSRNDIPVDLGDVISMNQSDKVFPRVGDCTCEGYPTWKQGIS